jgi:hypothetical protein
MRRAWLVLAVSVLGGLSVVGEGANGSATLSETVAPECTDFGAAGDMVVGLGPEVGLTELTFSCSGAESVKGGPWSLEVKVVTRGHVSLSGVANTGQVDIRASPGGSDKDGIGVTTFRNGGFTGEWLNQKTGGPAVAGNQLSSCRLKVDVTVVLQEGLKDGQPNNIVIGSAEGIVAGCGAPSVTSSTPAFKAAVRRGQKEDDLLVNTFRFGMMLMEKDLGERVAAENAAFAKAQAELEQAKAAWAAALASAPAGPDAGNITQIESDLTATLDTVTNTEMKMSVAEEQHDFHASNYLPDLKTADGDLTDAMRLAGVM